MKGAISRFRNGRSQEELDSRLHELCDDLETKVRMISEIPAEQGVHDTDREIIHNYFLRLRKGVKGDHKQAVESNIVYAEVVCQTALGVDWSYIARTCRGTDDSAALLREMITGFETIQQEIGIYDATKYGQNPLEREGTFSRIMLSVIREDLRPHVQAIKGDDASFDESFRRYADWAYRLISQAVPPNGSIRLDYLTAPLNSMSFDEGSIARLFPDNQSARAEAEGFLNSLRLMNTLAGRYFEHRVNLF